MGTRRNIGRILVMVAAMGGLSGVAAADSVEYGVTGPSSVNTVTITETNNTTVTNTNSVQITDTSIQQATTGATTISGNTAVAGAASSGAAVNNSTQTTTVGVSNEAVGGQGQGSGERPTGEGSCGQTCVNPGQGGESGAQTPTNEPIAQNEAAGKCASGCVLAAQTVGGKGAGVAAVGEEQRILPVTGSENPIDVSALRAAFESGPGSDGPALKKAGSGQYTAWLLTAAVLCLMGAIGSTVRAQQRVRGV